MQKSFRYYRPKTFIEALQLLNDPAMQAIPLVIGPKPENPRNVGDSAYIDFSLLGLEFIRESQDGNLHIGALATLQEIIDSPFFQNGPLSLLRKAAQIAASPGIRNLSSLYGMLLAPSGPAEISLVLTVLDSELIWRGSGENQRKVTFQEVILNGVDFTGTREILSEITIPPHTGQFGWALERVSRTPRDDAIVVAAALVEIQNGKAKTVRLALAGAHPKPVRLSTAENILLHSDFDKNHLTLAVDEVMTQADPIEDFRGGRDYRQAMAGLVARRALQHAWECANLIPAR